jgi:hypothetical protein
MSSKNLDLLSSFFSEQDYFTKYPDARLVVASGTFPSLKTCKIILLPREPFVHHYNDTLQRQVSNFI